MKSKHSVVNGGGINFAGAAIIGTITQSLGSPTLPDITIEDYDENGNKVCMTLNPDPMITAFEVIKIMHMLAAWAGGDPNFSPYLFVKKMQFERHFKIV